MSFVAVGVCFVGVGVPFAGVGVCFVGVGVPLVGIDVCFACVGVCFAGVGVLFVGVGAPFVGVGVCFVGVGVCFVGVGVLTNTYYPHHHQAFNLSNPYLSRLPRFERFVIQKRQTPKTLFAKFYYPFIFAPRQIANYFSVMNQQEKRILREQKKKLKKQRREYMREEKQSLKRQKKEDTRIRRKEKNRSRKFILITFWNSLFKIFSKSTEKTELSHRKRIGAKRRKRYMDEERRSIKREKREMNKEIKPLRYKLLKARLKEAISNFISFLKHPVKIRKKTKLEKKIRKQVRQDIREMRYKRLVNSPANFAERQNRFWRYRKLRLKETIRNISSFFQLLKYIVKDKGLRYGYLKTFINSTALFILSFILVYYIYQLITLNTARIFDIPTVLYSYRIYWPLYTYSTLYTRMALIVIFGTGPFISLVLGILYYRLYLWARHRTVFVKTFLLWAAIHSVNMFFGSYIVGVVTRTGFIYSSEWLFLSNIFDVEEIIFMIVSVIALIIVGYYSTKYFILASNSDRIIEPKVRFFYILSKIFLPWMFGNLTLYLITTPNNPVELNILYLISILMIGSSFSNYNTTTMQMLKLPKVPKKFKIGWLYIIIVLIILFVIRMILQQGISFS